MKQPYVPTLEGLESRRVPDASWAPVASPLPRLTAEPVAVAEPPGPPPLGDPSFRQAEWGLSLSEQRGVRPDAAPPDAIPCPGCAEGLVPPAGNGRAVPTWTSEEVRAAEEKGSAKEVAPSEGVQGSLSSPKPLAESPSRLDSGSAESPVSLRAAHEEPSDPAPRARLLLRRPDSSCRTSGETAPRAFILRPETRSFDRPERADRLAAPERGPSRDSPPLKVVHGGPSGPGRFHRLSGPIKNSPSEDALSPEHVRSVHHVLKRPTEPVSAGGRATGGHSETSLAGAELTDPPASEKLLAAPWDGPAEPEPPVRLAAGPDHSPQCLGGGGVPLAPLYLAVALLPRGQPLDPVEQGYEYLCNYARSAIYAAERRVGPMRDHDDIVQQVCVEWLERAGPPGEAFPRLLEQAPTEMRLLRETVSRVIARAIYQQKKRGTSVAFTDSPAPDRAGERDWAEFTSDCERGVGHLSRGEWQVLESRRQGKTFGEIGAEVGMARQRVWEVCHAVVARLQKIASGSAQEMTASCNPPRLRGPRPGGSPRRSARNGTRVPAPGGCRPAPLVCRALPGRGEGTSRPPHHE